MVGTGSASLSKLMSTSLRRNFAFYGRRKYFLPARKIDEEIDISICFVASKQLGKGLGMLIRTTSMLLLRGMLGTEQSRTG